MMTMMMMDRTNRDEDHFNHAHDLVTTTTTASKLRKNLKLHQAHWSTRTTRIFNNSNSNSNSNKILLFLMTMIAIVTNNKNHAINAFKKQDFKTCEQSSFCNRMRDMAPMNEIRIGPLKSEDGADADAVMRFDLYNKEENIQVEIAIEGYKNGAVRLRIDDLSSPRYKPKDILFKQSSSSSSSEEEAELLAMRTKIAIEKNYVEFFADTNNSNEKNSALGRRETSLVFSTTTLSSSSSSNLNDQIRVRIEHNSPPSIVIERNGVEVIAFNREETFAFEKIVSEGGDEKKETFNSHTDTRPFGNAGISFDISFPRATDVYGLPERATSLSLKPTIRRPISQEEVDQKLHHESEPYRLYNLDVFEYEAESPFGLYGSIPMLIAHGVDSLTSGVYFHNPTETYVDIIREESSLNERTSHWMAESGALDLFLFTGPDVQSVNKMYGDFLGTTALPPMFSLGYHQCRWNYRDEQDVEEVDNGFDEHEIPYDVIWLDIEHTDGKRYMTWDSSKFPTPERMINNVAEKGRKMVVIIDPHVKKDNDYAIFKEAESNGYYVKKNDKKTDFDGWCWPGSSMYLDVTNEDVRTWWASKFALDSYKGSTPDLYVWNDMNEPSVFNGPEITMQKDLIHHGDVEHREVHNIFGMYYHMATADGIEKRQNERPFVLSRAFFAGTQRIGPIWTGDNAADWSHLKVSIPMLLTLGLTGLPFSGADIGGFFGNPDAELLVRWYQLGAFYPFMRGHAHIDTKRREPWLFGDDNTNLIRAAIRNRYRLLPTIYTLFDENQRLGTPIIRPMFYEFPKDPVALRKDDCFMLGDILLVYPVLEQGATQIEIYLPKGVWFDVSTNEKHVGPKTFLKPVTMSDIPQFQRGGSILITKERPRRSSKAQRTDPITITIAPNEKGEAKGYYYNDDGITFAHTSVIAKGLNRKQLWWSKNTLATSDDTTKGKGKGEVNYESSFPAFIDETEVERLRVLFSKEDVSIAASFQQANLNPINSRKSNQTSLVFDESNSVLTVHAPFVSMHGFFIVALV